jgi:hypothetical protein
VSFDQLAQYVLDDTLARSLPAFWPELALWGAGVWIVFQPMQMRGMVH